MFITTKRLLADAIRGGYAVGAFNINNMELVQGIVSAAKELDSPLILQVSRGARDYAGRRYIMKLAEAAEDDSGLPIAVHLDHGDSFELCKAVIDDGFTSVMIDGSHLRFEENIEITRRVVDYAHDRGVSVEAELGRLVGEQHDVGEGSEVSREAFYTDPLEAKKFVERTSCDSLAVAIGTSHGAYKFKGEPKLDLERLRQIRMLVSVPLVLHGASSVLHAYIDLCNRYGAGIKGSSGVPEEQIREAVRIGVQKVNIDTDLRIAMTAGVRRALFENVEEFDPRKYIGSGRALVKEVVMGKIRILGCEGMAKLFL